jgi:hypothetical protein
MMTSIFETDKRSRSRRSHQASCLALVGDLLISQSCVDAQLEMEV